MNKGESVAAIADATGLSKKDVKEFFENLAELTLKTVRKGDVIFLPGIGKFDSKRRKAREARNPHSGKKMKVPAKTVLRFKAEKAMKQGVNK